ncbi:molybdopterin-dependent oxidoreductase [uncultured Mailhella sp.]|uniref:molybdopterin-containing oxidoreductase family protein n=1 Tax=uncultured Mailhella sp. TaxID=1981031 RepID=UPI0025CF7B2A|nr:molybdopterin-dependent oxidoreductase [uncultured Mailhella sp.]
MPHKKGQEFGKGQATALTLEEAEALAAARGEAVIPTWCGMCGPRGNCAIYAFVKDGRFLRVAGLADAPHNRGGTCCQAHAAPQWVYSEDRLTAPLRRTGKKGEGKFERISWDEALGIIAEKLKAQKEAYGPESLAILSPARRDYSEYLYRLLVAHGSPNYGHSGICAMQLHFGFCHTIGMRPTPDYRNADVILIWGRQPVYSGPPLGSAAALVEARARGARIYAIKPSLEADGGFASDWIPVRPGTDAALALAMLHVVTRDDLIDHEFVKTWCFGYEALAEHVRRYSPQWAEKICGVSAETIEELARTYATTKKATIDVGNGLEHAPSAGDAIRAIAMLMAVTGHLDRPGSNLFAGPGSTMPAPRSVHLKDRYTATWLEKIVGPEFPREFQPFREGTSAAYPRLFADVLSEKPTIHAIIAPGSQPTVSTRNPRGVIKALEKLDFYVVIDTHRTADTAFADIVLPALTPYEIDHPFEVRGPFIMARNKVIEPVGEGRSMQQIMLDIGTALGYGDDFWHGDMKACMDWQLEPLGMSMEELRSHRTGIVYPPAGARQFEKYETTFHTKSSQLDKAPYLAEGKVALFNTRFEKAGFAPMPEWREPVESVSGTPELLKDYPFVLSDYHTSRSFSAGWQRNVPYLREVEKEPSLHIHPKSARSLGIADGDRVKVTSPHGSLVVKAQYYPGIREDTVMLLHGWWQGCPELGLPDMPLTDGGANVNLLYSPDIEKSADPIVTAMGSQTLVNVTRV